MSSGKRSTPINITSYILLTGLLVYLLFRIVQMSYDHPIYIFDEAVYANNALEMSKLNSYWTYTNNGVIDHYNTKPPLVLWMQALFYKIIGYSEIAVRLPSLFALIGIILLYLYYSHLFFGNMLIGFIAGVFLITIPGAMRDHVFLSGDLDGVLTFFTTAICLHHVKVIVYGKIGNKDYFLYFFLFLLSYLAKSTSIFLFIPALMISLFFNKQLIRTFSDKKTYLYALLLFILLGIFYFFKELYAPGHFTIVWFSEYQRIYKNIMPWHERPVDFYFDRLYYEAARSSVILLFITLPVFYFLGDKHYRKIVTHLLILGLGYLFLISIPAVKLAWYDAPVFPVLAFVLSILCVQILDKVAFFLHANQSVITMIALFPLFIFRGKEVLGHVHDIVSNYSSLEKEALALKTFSRKYPAFRPSVLMAVSDIHHYESLNFYRKVYEMKNHKDILIYQNLSQVVSNDTLIVAQQDKLDSLKNKFSLMLIDSTHSAYLLVTKENL